MQSEFWNLTFISDVLVYLNKSKMQRFGFFFFKAWACVSNCFFTPFLSVSCTDITTDQRHRLCPIPWGSEAAILPTSWEQGLTDIRVPKSSMKSIRSSGTEGFGVLPWLCWASVCVWGGQDRTGGGRGAEEPDTDFCAVQKSLFVPGLGAQSSAAPRSGFLPTLTLMLFS